MPDPAVRAPKLQQNAAYVRPLPGHPKRHVNVLVGEVLCDDSHRYFAGVEQDSPHRHSALVRARLEQLGYTQQTELTVLTDGEDALRLCARRAAGKAIRPILDWFHIAMRVQHLKQLAKGLSTRAPTHVAATATIQNELERLHWRLWHGRTDAVDVSIWRLIKSVSVLQAHKPKRRARTALRSLWAMIYKLRRYVRGNANIIVDYDRRQRAGQRVSTSLVESAVNNLVNRRMCKRQQMRWSAHGAHRLLQVRAAVINGEFGKLMKAESSLPESDERVLALAA